MAREAIAIEPSQAWQAVLRRKGYSVYSYAEDAAKDWAGKVDAVTSFDVIEHVDDPVGFLRGIHGLLRDGGEAIVGTPTDVPVMRRLLGSVFEDKILFMAQHPWIFSAHGLLIMAKEAGFSDAKVEFKQRYSLGNMLGWLLHGEPHDVEDEFFSGALDSAWRRECEERGMADYMVLRARR